MNTDKRLYNCNFVKTILMLSVVLYHSVLFWNGRWFSSVEAPAFTSTELKLLSELLNTFHIYSFTLVSGYIFCYMKNEKGAYNHFVPFMKKKFVRLIIPYLFVSIVWVVPAAFIFFHYDFVTIFKRYILMIAPNQLWFLIMLFNVFCLSYPLSKLFNKKITIGFLVLLCFFIGTIGNVVFPDVFQIWTSLKFMLYFWLGYYLRQNFNSLLWKIPSIIYIFAIGILFITLKLIPDTDIIIFKLITIAIKNTLTAAGSVTAFIILQRLANHIKYDSKIYRFISSNSMVVYLFHQQLIYCTLCLFNGILTPYIHAGINFVFSLTVSLLLSFLLKKNKVTRFLLGEK